MDIGRVARTLRRTIGPPEARYQQAFPVSGSTQAVAVAVGSTVGVGFGDLVGFGVAPGAVTLGVAVLAGCDGRAGAVVSGLRVGDEVGLGRFVGAGGAV